MEASGRGAQATAAWLRKTPDVPTLVLVNALPNGTHGTHARHAIEELRREPAMRYPLTSIRKSVVIEPLLYEERPQIELIRRHPMLDDYQAVWAWVRDSFMPTVTI